MTSDIASAFDIFGEQHARKPRKRARPSPQEREQAQQDESQALRKQYRRAVKEDRERCYALPGGEDAKTLVAWAKRMTVHDGDDLIARVKRLRGANKAVRRRLLSDLDEAIVNLRIREGMPAFDDPLPGDDDDVFRVIREVLV